MASSKVKSKNVDIPITSDVLPVTPDGVNFVINEKGSDIDVRIEGDTDVNLIYIDAGADRVGISTATPAVKLHVAGDTRIVGTTGATLTLSDATHVGCYINPPSTGDAILFFAKGAVPGTNYFRMGCPSGSNNFQLREDVQADDPIIWEVVTNTSTFGIAAGSAQGQRLNMKSSMNSHTLAAANTSTISNFLPAGSLILGFSIRVTTAMTTSAASNTCNIGDGTDVDRFGLNIAGALNTTTTLADWTITSPPIYSAATNLVFTAPGVETFSAGVIRVTAHYIDLTAATS